MNVSAIYSGEILILLPLWQDTLVQHPYSIYNAPSSLIPFAESLTIYIDSLCWCLATASYFRRYKTTQVHCLLGSRTLIRTFVPGIVLPRMQSKFAGTNNSKGVDEHCGRNRNGSMNRGHIIYVIFIGYG